VEDIRRRIRSIQLKLAAFEDDNVPIIKTDATKDMLVAHEHSHGVCTTNNTVYFTCSEGIKSLKYPDDAALVYRSRSVLTGLCKLSQKALLVCDKKQNKIFKLDLDRELMNPIAGYGKRGFLDGQVSIAQFNMPVDVVYIGDGEYAVADCGNHAIRVVSRLHVKTIAGGYRSMNGSMEKGFRNGLNSLLNTPIGITYGNDTIFVADHGNRCIRTISRNKPFTVGTFNTAWNFENIGAVTFDVKFKRLLVADGRAVVVFDEAGKLLRAFPVGEPIVGLSGQVIACTTRILTKGAKIQNRRKENSNISNIKSDSVSKFHPAFKSSIVK